MQKQTRRTFLKTTTTALAAASAMTALNVPFVHAAEDNTIRLALIGCGGRGSGAIVNALATTQGPVKLVAMADVFADRIPSVYDNLAASHKDQVDVPADHKFICFDAHAKAMVCLRPGDVAIMTTPR